MGNIKSSKNLNYALFGIGGFIIALILSFFLFGGAQPQITPTPITPITPIPTLYTIDQRQESWNYNTVLWNGQGQTFTTGSGTNQIPNIDIIMAKVLPTESITLNLYNSTSKSILLGTTTVNPAQVSENFAWVSFVFPTPIIVSPNTQYYFEIKGQAEQYKIVFSDSRTLSQNSYPLGDYYFLNIVNQPYLFEDGTGDMAFRTFKT